MRMNSRCCFTRMTNQNPVLVGILCDRQRGRNSLRRLVLRVGLTQISDRNLCLGELKNESFSSSPHFVKSIKIPSMRIKKSWRNARIFDIWIIRLIEFRRVYHHCLNDQVLERLPRHGLIVGQGQDTFGFLYPIQQIERVRHEMHQR